MTDLHMCAIIKSVSRAKSTVAASRPGGVHRQLGLTFRSWGGRRPGAGRPQRPDRGASHLRRPSLASRHPLHVSLSVEKDLPSLRSPRLYRLLEDCLGAGKERFGFRLVHFAVQKHHLHLIVEAKDAQALARAIKGLGVRIARRLNAALGRRGRVFSDRYFARALRTPRETWAAVRYVLRNASHCTSSLFGRNPEGELVWRMYDSVVRARTRLLQNALAHLRAQQFVSPEYPRTSG